MGEVYLYRIYYKVIYSCITSQHSNQRTENDFLKYNTQRKVVEELRMDSWLEQEYLDSDKYTDQKIEEIRDEQYWKYRGSLNDFRHLFPYKINDVVFETKFEKLMNNYLDYRLLNLVDGYRKLHKSFSPYLDKNGNIPTREKEFDTDEYSKKSLTSKKSTIEKDDEITDK